MACADALGHDFTKHQDDDGGGDQANSASGEVCQQDGQSAVDQGVSQQQGTQQ